MSERYESNVDDTEVLCFGCFEVCGPNHRCKPLESPEKLAQDERDKQENTASIDRAWEKVMRGLRNSTPVVDRPVAFEIRETWKYGQPGSQVSFTTTDAATGATVSHVLSAREPATAVDARPSLVDIGEVDKATKDRVLALTEAAMKERDSGTCANAAYLDLCSFVNELIRKQESAKASGGGGAGGGAVFVAAKTETPAEKDARLIRARKDEPKEHSSMHEEVEMVLARARKKYRPYFEAEARANRRKMLAAAVAGFVLAFVVITLGAKYALRSKRASVVESVRWGGR